MIQPVESFVGAFAIGVGPALAEGVFEGVLATSLGQPKQLAGSGVEHAGDEARATQAFFINEQSVQPVEPRRGQLGLEDIAVGSQSKVTRACSPSVFTSSTR